MLTAVLPLPVNVHVTNWPWHDWRDQEEVVFVEYFQPVCRYDFTNPSTDAVKQAI